jgi:hypothetical protein
MNPDDLDTAYSLDTDGIWDHMSDPREKEEIASLNVRLATIEKRLSILVPDSELLKRYEVLQDLYSQYKAAEALLDGPDPEEIYT